MNCAEYQERLVVYLEGLLEGAEKQAVEEHLNTCETCRTELQGLQTLQARLVRNGAALAGTNLEDEVMNRIIREQSVQLRSARQAGVGLRLRRLIMKSAIAKLAVAAVVVLAVVAALSLWTGTKGVVLADVLAKVEQVQAFVYKMTMRTEEAVGETSIEATALIANEYGMRMDLNMTMAGTGQKMAQQMYMLTREGKLVTVLPDMKKYMRMDVDESLFKRMQEQGHDPRLMIRQILASQYTALGQSVIDGVEVEGFQTTDPAYAGNAFGDVDVKLWVSTKNWLPVRMEMNIQANEQTRMRATLYDFQWDIPATAADFTPALPADFTPGPGDGVKMPAINETSALEGLRVFVTFTDRYPESLNLVNVMQAAGDFMESQTPGAQQFREQLAQMKSDEERVKKSMELMIPVQSLAGFYALLVQEKKEPAYYGKVVTPGDLALVLMRWKTGDNEYRVLFGDLHAETVNAETLAKLEAALPK